jgi:hypothetical protein
MEESKLACDYRYRALFEIIHAPEFSWVVIKFDEYRNKGEKFIKFPEIEHLRLSDEETEEKLPIYKLEIKDEGIGFFFEVSSGCALLNNWNELKKIVGHISCADEAADLLRLNITWIK